MHRTRLVIGFTAMFLTTGIVVTAKQGHSGAPKPAHATAPHAAAGAKPATAPKAVKPVSMPKATKPASAQKPMKPASTPKTTKVASASAAKVANTSKPAPVKVAKTEKPSAAKVAKSDKAVKDTSKTGSTGTVATTTPTGTTTGTTQLTPVQEKLKKNTNLASKLSSRLPAGTDLMLAAEGFRNLGQFVAAVNVSKNLDIPFADLKTKMVTDGKSLGQAIQSLKSVASPTIEAQHAEYDARGMIAESEQQPQVAPATTTTAKPKTKKRAE